MASLEVTESDAVNRLIPQVTAMFVVENSTVIAIQAAFETSGLPAAIRALRDQFTIADDAAAAECVQRILRWTPVDETVAPVAAKPVRRRSVRRSTERSAAAH